jgi:hypothetical protein
MSDFGKVDMVRTSDKTVLKKMDDEVIAPYRDKMFRSEKEKKDLAARIKKEKEASDEKVREIGINLGIEHAKLLKFHEFAAVEKALIENWNRLNVVSKILGDHNLKIVVEVDLPVDMHALVEGWLAGVLLVWKSIKYDVLPKDHPCNYSE